MPPFSPLPHETGAFSQEVEVNKKEASQSASSPLPENSAAGKAMPYMPLNEEPRESAEMEDQAAIAQLTSEIMNGDDDGNDSVHTAPERDMSPVRDVAETPAIIKSVDRRKTPASAKMTPASVRSVEAKVASASRPQRVTPRGKSNITNGTTTTASTSRKRGSTGPLSGRAAKKTKVVEDNEDEYEVEAIVDDGIDDDTYEHMYEVKWKGYNNTTWEPLTNLNHCKDLITAYEKSKKPTGRNASSVRGRGRGRGRSAGKTSATKAAIGKSTADKSSRGRGRGRGRPATTARASKAEAEKAATGKIAAAKKAAASKARAARAATSASKRTATNASTAKKSRGGKATRGGRGRPRRSA